MWSSVWWCAGIASESSEASVVSWTSRSKIWDVAGERWRGEAERAGRLLLRVGECEKGELLRWGEGTGCIACDIAD